MFTIDNDLTIHITRGDIANIRVSMESEGEPYEFKGGDIVRFRVFGKKDCANIILQKDFPIVNTSETAEIFLSEEDTKIGGVINKHTDYWYEVELNPDTKPQTIIGYDEDGAKIFRLYPEGRNLTAEDPDVTPEDFSIMDSELDLTSKRPVENQAIARAVVSLNDSVNLLNKSDRAISLSVEVLEEKYGADVPKLQGDVADAQKDISDLSTDTETLKTDVGTLKTDTETLKTNVKTNETNITNLQNKVSNAHPVGSVYITSTNTNPALKLGGTWVLIDKEFSSKSGMDAYGVPGVSDSLIDKITNCSGWIKNPTVSYARGGHSIYVRFEFTTNQEIDLRANAEGKTPLFGEFNMQKLGISTITFTKTFCGNFYMNGYGCGLLRVFTYDTNKFAITGIDGAAYGVIPEGAACNIEFTETAHKDAMLDSACDKFYWKRTA